MAHDHDGCCGHDHGGLLHVHAPTSGRGLWIALGITTVFVAGEIVAGVYAGSLALLSDAGHNASDALALGLAAYAVRAAERPPDRNKTYGYHRISILSALLSAASLVGIAGLILIEAARDLLNPGPVNAPVVMGVAAVAVFMNTVIAWMLSQGAKSSMNIRAAYLHMAGDALSAAGVLFAGWIMRATGWSWVDPVISALIAVFILVTSWGVLRQATNILLEAAPEGLDVEAMAEAMGRTEGVLSVHDLHVWTVSDGRNYLSCHVGVPGDFSMTESAALIDQLNNLLARDFGIGHATVQVEPHGTCQHGPGLEGLVCDGNPRGLR